MARERRRRAVNVLLALLRGMHSNVSAGFLCVRIGESNIQNNFEK